MKRILCSVVMAMWLASVAASQARAQSNAYTSSNDVTWTSLGTNENDSMPIGNGDLAANVWTEKNGDLVLLVAKADAWSEMGKLLKLGRVRVRMSPNPFSGGADFTQVLHVEDGTVEIKSGGNTLRVWADANRPVIHVEVKLEHPATMEAKLEIWRTETHPYSQPSPDKGGMHEFGDHDVPLSFEPDTVLPAAGNRLAWYHYNRSSIYPIVASGEHLDQAAQRQSDPILHRCFGALLKGPGLESVDDHTLRSRSPGKGLQLDLVALTEAQARSPEAWKADLDQIAHEVDGTGLSVARSAHEQWWRSFWDRSWIHVTGTADADRVSQGYVMQRYMMAASSRGRYPTKFNGGLFTVGHDMPGNRESTIAEHNADFRQWGNSYWNQNNRLLYWPLVGTGDYDLLKPWFSMYLNALPLAKDRTSTYYHHPGAAFIETIYFWGLPNLEDFGWDNPKNEMKSEWIRYHIQGTLEVIAQMLDEYEATEDPDFARQDLVPFAEEILTYYDRHWPRGEDGKLKISPAQALETYEVDAVNPTPDLAGLKAVLPRLLSMPSGLLSAEQRRTWTKLLNDVPEIAVGRTVAGKLPRAGASDPNGQPTILPAERYGKPRNVENPELYVLFPYQLYGVGKPDLARARTAFAARLFPQDTCWGQDGPQAAVLGLTSMAKKAATDEFTDFGDQRFPWFWKAGHDWIPDLDNGGTGMMTLQLMLLQTTGRQIELAPAWPKDWTADFKLHAPYRTTVEAHVENGKVTRLKVTPTSRAKDVVVLPVREP